MIATLNGTLRIVGETSLVVDVGGVGYEVFVSRNRLALVGLPGTTVFFYIYTHFSDSHIQLFGFVDDAERDTFLRLISVSGVGPKMALSILSQLSVDDLIRAITSGETSSLTAVSGIGKKTAERLVVELKDKFKTYLASGRLPVAAGPARDLNNHREDAVQALVALGYAEMMARRALDKIGSADGESVQSLIRKSLGALSS